MRAASRARGVLAVLLLVSLTLILLDVRGSGAVDGVRGIAAGIVGPIQRAVGAAAAPAISVARSVTSFGDQAERQQVAAQQLSDVSNGTDAAARTAQQSESVDALLRTAGLGGYRVLPARVIAYGSAQTFNGTVTIDAGSGDGIEKDMTVMNGEGLVGKVVSVGPVTADVQLLSDDGSVIGARIEGSGQVGALQGTGQSGEAVLRLLDPTAGVSVGDRIVSFGSPDGRPYAAGLPLGTVSGLRGDPGQADRVALIRPAVALTALDIVGVVVVPPRTNPRDSVLPPKPKDTPGPTPSPSG